MGRLRSWLTPLHAREHAERSPRGMPTGCIHIPSPAAISGNAPTLRISSRSAVGSTSRFALAVYKVPADLEALLHL